MKREPNTVRCKDQRGDDRGASERGCCMSQPDVIIGIGGAAGDGVASAGNTLAVSVARQGQAVFAYNSYQSVIRGGHSWLRLRISGKKPLNHGDQVDAFIALNQDTLDRHLQELRAGGLVLYNAAKLTPRYEAPNGVQLCQIGRAHV